ncbi:uncharacterized protein LOC128870119 [Anastrepha ludens]|uniref:uncharacterized protein LOC128870119 n=1 Tax=Anastrepha ludens TaxID=28586 RepID=UPI0023B05A77|nr:uncharacterized protein LOC128870119 [Anastrepha ludens]
MIDTRLSFKQHLAAVNNKAAAVMGALTKILPNIGGPQGERRKLLSTVVDSIILYAAPVWAEAKNIHVREVVHTHRRSALWVSCAYRTVSDDAICAVAGKLPFDIHARELRRLYSEPGAKPTATEKAIERERCMYVWQRRWEESLKRRWTYKLISHLGQWVKRKHGETDYYLTQILTGRGYFMEYLHRFQLAESPFYPSCPNAIESAEHVAFHCDRFARERAILERALGHSASPNDIVQDMCSSSAKWVAVRAFAGKIMLRLQFIEWVRKTQQQKLQLQLRNGDELFPDRMMTNTDT